MPIKGQSRSDRFTRWELLVSNLKESAALPHVTEEVGQLETMLSQARALQVRYEDLRTQAREVLVELQKLGRAGDRVRGRLGANLRGKLGFTSESLTRYGYKPNPVNRRKAKQPAPTASKTPAGDDTASKSEV